jgi:hypothetical protein
VGFFVFPQAWVGPAIAAAAMAFGSVHGADDVHIKYRNLRPGTAGTVQLPDTILIDKRRRVEWPREKAQCVLVHEYGHLAGRHHSKNPRSIMYPVLRYPPCHSWLVRHGL